MFVDPRQIVALITVIVGVGAVVITVQVINRNRLKEIAKQKAKNELSFKIKNCLKEGNCNFVNIGLLDTNQNETQEIQVRAEQIESDFVVGEIIAIYL